jgi:RimJ/RimL family protein N-acetyltransferase
MSDNKRKYFAIIHNKKVIGQIYLKHIKLNEKTTEFGIALVDDTVKGKGYGTEAINLLISYVFNILNLETIKADSVIRNTRSQHVLEKCGFKYINVDSEFKYFVLKK